jgi:hypothetical protein
MISPPAAGWFDTVTGDAAQDAVLTDAFAGGFVVSHRIAGAAVQPGPPAVIMDCCTAAPAMR